MTTEPQLPKLPPTPGEQEVRRIQENIPNPAAYVWGNFWGKQYEKWKQQESANRRRLEERNSR